MISERTATDRALVASMLPAIRAALRATPGVAAVSDGVTRLTASSPDEPPQPPAPHFTVCPIETVRRLREPHPFAIAIRDSALVIERAAQGRVPIVVFVEGRPRGYWLRLADDASDLDLVAQA